MHFPRVALNSLVAYFYELHLSKSYTLALAAIPRHKKYLRVAPLIITLLLLLLQAKKQIIEGIQDFLDRSIKASIFSPLLRRHSMFGSVDFFQLIVETICVEFVEPPFAELVEPICVELVDPPFVELVKPICVELVDLPCVKFVEPPFAELV